MFPGSIGLETGWGEVVLAALSPALYLCRTLKHLHGVLIDEALQDHLIGICKT